MQTLTYEVSFLTPAFLGNAEQTGQWRVPPFKALLRQWWRVAYAADHGFNVNIVDMHREEGLLFGNAWLTHCEGNRDVKDYCKSLVQMRLDQWHDGRETKDKWGLQELDKNSEGVTHPEVGEIGPKLYLGYGPLGVQKVERKGQKPEYATVLKQNAAIQTGEANTLSLAVPDEHAPRIKRALWLIDRYGTIGGRSRNGWGSFMLTPINGTPKLDGKVPLRNWQDCLTIDWPHAIGQNERGALIWQTKPFDDWKTLMRELAIIKIGLRTQFVFPSAKPPHTDIEPRHWLSYPITTHTTQKWDRGARLPNQLRFKVRRTDDGKLVGIIFHVLHLPPASFSPNADAIITTWQQVHDLLNHLTTRSPRSYTMITDTARRAALKPHLDTITLTSVKE